MNIEGSVGLVTGGASGLGEGTVRVLAENGGKAAILDLPTSSGARLAKELGEAVQFFPVDVTETDQVEQAVNAAYAHFGRVDLCANCAGVGPAHRVVDKKGNLYPLEEFRQVVELNLIGLFDVLRRAAFCMTKNEPSDEGERGLIVNVSSIAGLEGQIGQHAYSGSKGGVAAMTLPLARDLATWGIRVMTICPGIMDTPMLASASDELKQALVDIHVFPKRLGRAEDFAKLVRSFMENTLVNGDVVRLDAATRLGPR